MKYLLIIILMFSAAVSFAQPSDFILVKHKERTIATWFTGTSIRFVTNTGASIDAKIISIRNDTLFLKEYVIRQMPTQLGVYILDTAYYYYQYHYNEVKAIGRSGRHFDWGGSGATLMGGGLLLTVASGVVYIADNKKFSPELLAASAGLFGIGYLLSRKTGKGMEIGKKYSLVYIKTDSEKKN